MRSRKKIITMLMAIVLLLFPVFEVSASSLSEAQKEKQALQAELAKAQDLIDGLKDSKEDIQSKVAELDAQLTAISEQINDTEAKLDAKSIEIEDTQALIEEAQATVDEQSVQMGQRIKYMYENSGQTSYLDAFFRSGSIAEFLNQAEYIRQITDYDRKMLTEYEDSLEAVTNAKATLEQEYADLEELKAQVQTQKDAVQALVDAKEAELSNVSADLSDAVSEADAVQAEIDSQDEIIAQIQAEQARKEEEEAKRKAEAEANGTEPTTPPEDTYSGGAFTWPCPSSTRVTSDYGTRLSPTNGASSNHKGIDIAASYGADIVAAADGTVTFAGYSNATGNYVMVSHGSGLYTVYCHASSLLVSKGQTVTKGQTIAKIGSTGISTGNHLHFGVSLNGSYVSPWNYLSK